MELTAAQAAAVEHRGGDLLVSAAAGSGKTFVLVRRLMERVLREGVDIDRFLVITFTRDAAAQLRGRIMEELRATGSARQLALLHRAKIGTIDSFCTSILREYAAVLDLDPDFRVLDEDEARRLRGVALEALLERKYVESDPDFLNLADTVGEGRDDKKLAAAVLEVYEKAVSMPDPESWLTSQIALEAPLCGDSDTETCEAMAVSPAVLRAAERCKADLRRAEKGLQNALQEMEMFPGMKEKYAPAFRMDVLNCENLLKAMEKGWNEVFSTLYFSDLPLGTLRSFPYAEVKERVQAARSEYKAAVADARELWYAPLERVVADARLSAGPTRELLTLAIELMHEFSSEKRRRGLMDFADLEQYALSLLKVDEYSDEIRARFTEIMVDEYQDINRLQEEIFQKLSNGSNLVMVGDVKQSIYGFRQATPDIFIEKYNGDCDRVDLNANFRSRPEVIEAVNDVFSLVMSPTLGGLSYDEGQRLVCGRELSETPDTILNSDAASNSAPTTPNDPPATSSDPPATPNSTSATPNYPPAAPNSTSATPYDPPATPSDASVTPNYPPVPRLWLVDKARAGREREAELCAELVAREISSGTSPDDIVILLRSPAGRAAAFLEALEKRGVPCRAGAEGGIFERPEVAVLVSYLEIIDNPVNDSALISVLRSRLWGFTADELAEIRLADRTAAFWQAMRLCENEKAREFVRELDLLRLECTALSADEIVWKLLSGKKMLSLYSGDALLAVCAYAERACAGTFLGLYPFVQRLRAMRDEGRTLPLLRDAGGGAVRIMSVHRSKGLEFPVVFYCGLGQRFNMNDLSRSVLISREAGVGLKLLDSEGRIRRRTLAWRAVRRRMNDELLSEELRVLYVGMTRARDRLVLIAAPDSLNTLEREPSAAIAPVHWLHKAARERGWEIVIDTGDGESGSAADKANEKPDVLPEAPEIKAEIPSDFVYPYPASARAASKVTPGSTPFTGENTDNDLKIAHNSPETRFSAYPRPRFISERGLTPAERGTATHLVLQHINYSAEASRESVVNEISRLLEEQIITPAQAEAADAGKIFAFLQSPLGREAAGGSPVREFRFSLLTDAGEYYPGALGDELLLQGMIDLYFEGPRGLVIVDFKTGSDRDPEKYRPQLEAYAKALRRISGREIERKIVYYIESGREYYY